MASLQVLCSSATRRTNAIISCSFKIFGYWEKREYITESLLHATVALAYYTEVPKLKDLKNTFSQNIVNMTAESQNSEARRGFHTR
jgi:hypothetical protein